jgi:phosphate transport system substrate-binding protein
MRRAMTGALLAAVAILPLAACGGPEAGDEKAAEGSGSTFARQAMRAWCDGSDLCTYRTVGSGQGVADAVGQTTELGMSDVPLTDEEKEGFFRTSGSVAPDGTVAVQIPVLMGAVAVVTSVLPEGDPTRLRFTGRALAGIFSGAIGRWSDPAIAADNPGVALPDRPITRCVRKDSSGTTATLTTFLAQEDPAFAGAVAPSRLPAWPGARIVRFEGNEGMGACVRDRDDAIGYIDLPDGVTIFGRGAPPERVTRLAQIGVERDGAMEWVSPTPATTALAGSVELPDDQPLTSFGAHVLDSPIRGAYPIVLTTYMILHTEYRGARTCDQVVGTARYALSSKGQQELVDAYYAPLSGALRARALAELDRVTADDGSCGPSTR